MNGGVMRIGLVEQAVLNAPLGMDGWRCFRIEYGGHGEHCLVEGTLWVPSNWGGANGTLWRELFKTFMSLEGGPMSNLAPLEGLHVRHFLTHDEALIKELANPEFARERLRLQEAEVKRVGELAEAYKELAEARWQHLLYLAGKYREDELPSLVAKEDAARERVRKADR